MIKRKNLFPCREKAIMEVFHKSGMIVPYPVYWHFTGAIDEKGSTRRNHQNDGFTKLMRKIYAKATESQEKIYKITIKLKGKPDHVQIVSANSNGYGIYTDSSFIRHHLNPFIEILDQPYSNEKKIPVKQLVEQKIPEKFLHDALFYICENSKSDWLNCFISLLGDQWDQGETLYLAAFEGSLDMVKTMLGVITDKSALINTIELCIHNEKKDVLQACLQHDLAKNLNDWLLELAFEKETPNLEIIRILWDRCNHHQVVENLGSNPKTNQSTHDALEEIKSERNYDTLQDDTPSVGQKHRQHRL